jgi:hypothetical protein
VIDKYRYRFEIRPGKFAYIPTDEHRELAEKIIRKIRDRWSPLNWCYHIGKRGGHIAALRVHLPNRWRTAIDIARFFPSVTRTKLNRALKSIGFSFTESREISALSTVRIDGKFALPYGFLQSPLLATLALCESAFGREINRLIDEGFCVSVYVDDVIISHPTSKRTLQDALVRLIFEAERASFTINTTKVQPPSEEIVAFNVLLSGSDMRVVDTRMLEFREAVITNGKGKSSEAIIRYVEGINSAQARRLSVDLLSR